MKCSFPLTIVMEPQGKHVLSRGRGLQCPGELVTSGWKWSLFYSSKTSSDGKWQRQNEVQGSTFPKRVVTLLRLATVKM